MSTESVDDAPQPPPRSWADLERLEQPPELPKLAYGAEPQQFGELRLPPGVPGPYPVVVLIHGGCWRSDHGYEYLRPLAAQLSTLGVATWTIEYRRLGDPGGGWPNTFRDVAAATDHLRALAQSYDLDLGKVAAMGHSSGGQLALWLASRPRLRSSDELYMQDPLKLRAIIGLAPVTDLAVQSRAGGVAGGAESTEADGQGCAGVVEQLLDGDADSAAKRYARVSPIELLPLHVPQWLVQGDQDAVVSPDTVLDYAEAARAKGDRVVVGVTADAGHFEPPLPASSTWMTVQQAVIDALLE